MVMDLRVLPGSSLPSALDGAVHLLPDERAIADVAGYVEKLRAERFARNREERYRRSRGRSAVDWLEHHGCVWGLAAADEGPPGLSHGRHVEALRAVNPALVRLIDVLREVLGPEPLVA